MGEALFHAAVGSIGPEGGGGFAELTLWGDTSRSKVVRIGAQLQEQGWNVCCAGEEDAARQAIWRTDGPSVRVLIGITYWGSRRLRGLPERGRATGRFR